MRRTAGGTFNPADRPLVFSAGHADPVPEHPVNVLVAVEQVWSNTKEIDVHLDAGRTVMLDSGVFNLTTRHMAAHPGLGRQEAFRIPPEQVDGFAELRARYTWLVRTYADRLWGYVELDQGTTEDKRTTRRQLEAEGLAPIPVYHPLSDPAEYLDELGDGYDRICVGNFAAAHRSLRLAMLQGLWEWHRARPDLWLHALGLSPSALFHAYPVDSCDSSTWLNGTRWPSDLVMTADLARFSNFPPDARYQLGDRDSLQLGWALSGWTIHEQLANWRAHQAEAVRLGFPVYPEVGAV